ncbi:uncharacterized protein VICG_01326 [Vittaforma corneae ATCC 50505]|uniref:Uncharacterized protein n=1 Tax=Vittaforma corneae (strain ATCC 50505) TaxID=993615 RepID=L2GLD7_VITCO|nr:uncharacterized protein VICG_01326 [Vittaforma corneae ATCC 50505]ELA41693.1 hypothetical protein VICG_01326 [Vittaforma corneae ATCC 50505]
MVFERWRMQSKNTQDVLEVLKNRLESASYEEDRIETLQKLYSYSISNPNDVLDLCFDAIVKSIEMTDIKSQQAMILHALYTSSYSELMLEKFVSKNEYSQVVLRCDVHFISRIIRTINSNTLYSFLSEENSITTVLMSFIKNGYFKEFCSFVGKNTTLKETLVFEGAFEELMKIYTFEKRIMAREERIHSSRMCLVSLLDGSAKNQQYFFDSDLVQSITKEPIADDIEMLQMLLNPELKNYAICQKGLMQCGVLETAMQLKAYGIIYSLIDSNEENFKTFIENHLCLESLIEECDNSVEAFKIVELLARYTYFPIAHDHSFRINTLLCILGCSFADLNYLIVDAVQKDKLNMDHLIYLLFTQSTISSIRQYLNYAEYEEPLGSMCILIYLSFSIQLDLSPHQLIAKLKYLRLYFLNNKVTLDSINESVTSTIDQYIQQFGCTFERKEYSLPSKKDAEQNTSAPTINSVTESKSVIVEGVNNRIKSLFSKFTKKDQEKQNYDL